MRQKPATAEELLDLARSEPDTALALVPEYLSRTNVSGTDRSIVLRAGGLAARLTGDLRLSTAYLNESHRVATAEGDEVRATEAHLSLSANMFLEGDSEGAAALLAILQPRDQVLLARVKYQAGTMLARTGDTNPAMTRYGEALDAVTEAGDSRMTAMILKNRAMLRILGGDFVGATADIEGALERFRSLEMRIEVAYCIHNTGLIALHSGDIPSAFTRFTEAERAIRALAHSEWEVQAGHCQALVAAGLPQEAADMADLAIPQLKSADFHVDHAEALLIKAEAEATIGRPTAALTARQAKDAFIAQGRDSFAAIAAVLSAQIDAASTTPASIRGHAALLDESGMRAAGLNGWIVAADVTQIDDPSPALEILETISNRVQRADLQTRVAYGAALADTLLAAGRRRSAAQVVSSAARTLEDHQSLIGLSDIRLSFRPQANRIFSAGLEMAVESGRNSRVFDWIERTAVSRSLVRRAAPVEDPELRTALTELSTLKDKQDRPSRRRRVELESQVRLMARTRAPRVAPQRVAVGTVAAALDHRTLVSFAAVDGQALALRLRNGRMRRFGLGPTSDLIALVRQVRASLTRTAAKPDKTRVAESSRLLGLLDNTLVGPLGLDSAPAVLVAPAGLAGVPWSGLPSRRGHPTIVARSAAAWFDCDQGVVTSPQSLLIVTGPDLKHVDSEAATVAATAANAEIADHESVGRLVEQVENADVVHAVCHGDLRSDNPLFSSMRLHAGSIYAYQMQQLVNPPATVVLSACHLGLAKDSPGALLLGFTDALLSAGTTSVIASTLPVPDTEATSVLMADLHRRMAAGERPATALANSQADLPPDVAPLYASAFTCFGAG